MSSDNNTPAVLIASESVTLNNGTTIPIIGLGTWQLGDNDDDIENATYNAIKVGYRHIDTAKRYNNEIPVGKGIQRAINDGIITRNDIYIVTKVWNDDHHDVINACRGSLQRLGVDYIDLFLVHWPVSWYKDTMDIDNTINHIDIWKQMENVCKQGLAKSIGLSNFTLDQIENIINNCDIKPVVNQIECHPYFQQNELNKILKDKYGIYITAYSALNAYDPNVELPWFNLLENDTIQQLAIKYNKTPQQVILRWNIDVGNIVITRSRNTDRMKQNIDILTFKLDDSDIELIKTFKQGRYRNPKWGPDGTFIFKD